MDSINLKAKASEILESAELDSLDESIAINNQSDFTRAARIRASANAGEDKIHQVAFYKLMMTTSNMHSTVSDMYLADGNSGRAGYHTELSIRFRNEANKIKNG